MQKKILILASLFLSLFTFAQEVISTQGTTYSNASGSIDFTIGEVVINTGSNGLNDLTQGFHQTFWNFVGLEDLAPDYEVSIFPNPTQDVLNIRTSTFENVSYLLYDANGKVIRKGNLVAELTEIPVVQLAPGAYSLVLNYESPNLKPHNKELGSKSKTYKLIKTH